MGFHGVAPVGNNEPHTRRSVVTHTGNDGSARASAIHGRWLPSLTIIGLALLASLPALPLGVHLKWWQSGTVLAAGVLGLAAVRFARGRGGRRPPAPAVAAQAPGYLVPRDLPPAPPLFVGRRDELARGIGFLCAADPPAPRIVAVVGEPGIGKTTLAVRMAHAAAPHFPDGQLFVNPQLLAGAESGSEQGFAYRIIGYFLEALLGPADEVPVQHAARLALFRSTTRKLRVLFVLDEVEEAVSMAVLPELLPAGHGCGVVLTGHKPALADDHLVVQLGPLSLEDSIEMLSAIAGERVLAEPEQAGQLVEETGGHPLAVRVAATGLAALPHAPLATALRRLAQLRDGRGVARPLDPGVALLTAAEREALLALGLLGSGSFAPWQLAALLDKDEDAATDLADRLGLAGFVERTSRDSVGVALFVVPGQVREYARARLYETSTEQQRRVRTARLEQRLRDRHASDHDASTDGGLQERVYRPMWAGRLREAIGAARDGVAVARERGDRTAEGLALAAFAEVRAELGSFEAARELAHSALADQVVSDLAEERARRCLGRLHRRLRQLAPAEQELNSALEKASGTTVERALVLRELAILYAMRGPASGQDAVATMAEAVELSEQDPDEAGQLFAGMCWARAVVHHELGQYAQSGTALREGRQAAEQHGQQLVRAWLLHREARLALAVGDYQRAAQAGFDGIEAFAGMNHRYGKAHCRLAIGEALLGQGDQERARQILEEALENFINCADRWSEAETSRVLALACPPRQGDRARLLNAAARIFADLGDYAQHALVSDELSLAAEVAG
jgi:tetratricopeptide (TPR) repeat protein